MTASLPNRVGMRPRTHRGLPHQQLDQQPLDDAIGAKLAARLFALDGVMERPSGISVPGARALVLRDGALGPSGAFMIDREFAHVHPLPDQSLHITLPDSRAQQAIEAGWAEYHPFVVSGQLPPTHVMVYAPRDHVELEVVYGLVYESYRFARGEEQRTTAE
jgi:hypothetical protein